MGDETGQWLAEGIARAKAGERERARELLLRVVRRDERNAQAWLWISSVVEGPEDRRVALENVLAIEPENTLARAGLDWLDRQPLEPTPSGAAPETQPAGGQAADVPVFSDTALGLSDDEPALEQEGCPYCGQPVSESDDRCPKCRQSLTVRALERTEFPARVWLLAAAWIVQALADVANGALVLIALTMAAGLSGSALGASYIRTYLAGAAFASGALTPDLLRMVVVFVVFDVIAAAWSLVMAVVLPWRRSAALAVALFVAGLHVVMAISSFAVGMTSLWIGLGRLALGLFIGLFLLEAQGDFVWRAVRQRLELDRGAKSSMDYYSRGRAYKSMGQMAKAALHLERAVELAPERVAFRVALGNAHYALGQYDWAAEHIRAAVRLSPNSADLREFLERVNARLSSGDSRVG
jgi:tetratricopeptide (TPR) repeat protein